MWDWLRDMAIGIMPFLVIWLVWRTDRLGRQIRACTYAIQLEIARHDPERENELRDEWKSERKEARKEKRRALAACAIIGIVGLAIWVLQSR
jgi:hypothetical protein